MALATPYKRLRRTRIFKKDLIIMGRFRTTIRITLIKLFGKPFSAIPESLIRDNSLISFDVFDTLILRPGIAAPSDIFDLLHTEDSDFKKARIEAERIVREEGKRRGFGDIKLEQIYNMLYPDNPEKQQEGIDAEISIELKVCKANPEALAFFNSIREKQNSPRIIIISDMYLDKHTIETILTNCGYNLAGVNVYVSSEYGKTKRNGSLFKTVMKVEQVEKPEEVLHIGDSIISDYLNPRRVGMKSYLCSPPQTL